MAKRLSERYKYFWRQVLFGFLVAAGFVAVAGARDYPEPFDFGFGFATLGILSTVILIFKIAQEFTNSAYPKEK